MKCSPPVVIKGMQIKTRRHFVCPSNWQKLKRFIVFNIGKGKGKLAVSSSEGGNVNW